MMKEIVMLKRQFPKEIERFRRCFPFYIATDAELFQFLEDEKRWQSCYTKSNNKQGV